MIFINNTLCLTEQKHIDDGCNVYKCVDSICLFNQFNVPFCINKYAMNERLHETILHKCAI